MTNFGFNLMKISKENKKLISDNKDNDKKIKEIDKTKKNNLMTDSIINDNNFIKFEWCWTL